MRPIVRDSCIWLACFKPGFHGFGRMCAYGKDILFSCFFVFFMHYPGRSFFSVPVIGRVCCSVVRSREQGHGAGAWAEGPLRAGSWVNAKRRIMRVAGYDKEELT